MHEQLLRPCEGGPTGPERHVASRTGGVSRVEISSSPADGREAQGVRGGAVPTAGATLAGEAALPAYLRERYAWAYLYRRSVAIFDRPLVVSAILWGHYGRLKRAVAREITPGQHVLQAACVYGDFSVALARHVGPRGRLDVIDVAPLQVQNCRRKLAGYPQARVSIADAAAPPAGGYDVVCSFFLLHEVPAAHRRRVVDALLARLAPGGKAVFVDYHRPHWAHPLRGVMSVVFELLEPFAKDLWERDVGAFASASGRFVWSKQTYFGGLYQKTVARRPEAGDGRTTTAAPAEDPPGGERRGAFASR